MKNLSTVALAAIAAAALSGCIVAPVAPRHHAVVVEPAPVYVAPPGVVYVAPLYAAPGPGWIWQYHANYGWGWHHPQYGWHRGWR
jgi:hypothetical protein